jgi:hypothetical protein
MSLFEYLGVLISVVMGLGITHLLIGISKIIQFRNTVRIYWVHILWSINILVFILVIWWGMFWWSSLNGWIFYQFLFVTLYAIILFVLASLLFPGNIPSNFDFKEYFLKNRSWFFGLQILAWLVDIAETNLKAELDLRELPQWYFLNVGINISLALIAAITKNPRFHAFFAPFWLAFLLFYLGFTTLAKIAG